MLFHFHMVLVQPELLVAPAGHGCEVAILEFEFLRLLPHDAGRDGHRDLLRLAALVARAGFLITLERARYFTLL